MYVEKNILWLLNMAHSFIILTEKMICFMNGPTRSFLLTSELNPEGCFVCLFVVVAAVVFQNDYAVTQL